MASDISEPQTPNKTFSDSKEDVQNIVKLLIPKLNNMVSQAIADTIKDKDEKIEKLQKEVNDLKMTLKRINVKLNSYEAEEKLKNNQISYSQNDQTALQSVEMTVNNTSSNIARSILPDITSDLSNRDKSVIGNHCEQQNGNTNPTVSPKFMKEELLVETKDFVVDYHGLEENKDNIRDKKASMKDDQKCSAEYLKEENQMQTEIYYRSNEHISQDSMEEVTEITPKTETEEMNTDVCDDSESSATGSPSEQCEKDNEELDVLPESLIPIMELSTGIPPQSQNSSGVVYHPNRISSKSVRCDVCNLWYSSRDTLKKHIKCVHNKIKPFQCTSCDKAFTFKKDLKRHTERVHLKIKSIKCAECNISFTCNTNYKVHVDTVHLKMKPYSCPLCSSAFTQRGNLAKHVKTIHFNYKPYRCELCDSRFATKDKIQTHISSVHRKIKPFVCGRCDKGFPQKSDLNRHLTTVHANEEVFQCSECGSTFASQSDLANHVEAAHSEQDDQQVASHSEQDQQVASHSEQDQQVASHSEQDQQVASHSEQHQLVV